MKQQQIEISNISDQIGDYRVSLKHIGYEPPAHMTYCPPHAHSIFELHLIFSGVGTLITNDGEYELSDGVVCMTGPGVTHSQIYPEVNAADEYSMRFDIRYSPQKHSDKSLNILMKAFFDSPFYYTRADIRGCETIREMIDEARNEPLGFRLRIKQLMSDLLIRIARLYLNIESESQTAFDIKEIGEKDFKAVIDTSLYFYADPQMCEKIIEELHISKRHFSRLMDKFYGMSYTDKISGLRVDYAKQLLCDTDLSVEKIYLTVGFSTRQHFAKIFKRIIGMTPSEYRKSCRAKPAEDNLT